MSSLKTSVTLVLCGALSLSLLQPACGGSGAAAGGAGAVGSAGGPAAGAGAAGSGVVVPAAGSSNGGAAASGASSVGGATVAGGAPSGGAGGTMAAAGSAGSAGSGGAGHPVCVSGTGTTPVGDKSVTDNKTCLTWTKTRSAMPMTNKLAAKYCADLDQDGISDWRVPRPEELVTWPDLSTDSTSYITGPIYIPTASTDADGCTGDSHSCNIAKYNDTSVTCGWQGVGFQGWVECVSGTPSAGTTKPAYAAGMCSPCNSELASFREIDCSAYTN